MNYSLDEIEIANKLQQMKKSRQRIELSLRPAIGHTTIEKEGNTMCINEGRDGKWGGISEFFYDEMVILYDSRG
jgi:hypothetical protein